MNLNPTWHGPDIAKVCTVYNEGSFGYLTVRNQS